MAHLSGMLILLRQPTLLIPVFGTSSHNTIDKLFSRYLDTFIHLKTWYESDLFDKRSLAAKSMKKVNAMHSVVYHKFNSSLEPNANECLVSKKIEYVTQYDMVVTQWSSIGPVVLWPQKFGFYDISDHELEALAHHWRVIGYKLGIDDRFNCCLDTLPETQYFCSLILENDFVPILKQEELNYGMEVSVGLARAMNCLLPFLCFQGLLRYIYKKVLELPVYVEVDYHLGYRSLVYIIETMMLKSYWHWILSYALRFALFCVNLQRKAIAKYYERKYAHIDYQKQFEHCPYSKASY